MNANQPSPLPADRQPSPASLATLTAQAERARAGYKWQEAIEHYTAALALAGDQRALRCDLLDGRAECWRMLEASTRELADLAALAALAAAADDAARQAQAAARQSFAYRLLGSLEEARATAEAGLALARNRRPLRASLLPGCIGSYA